MDWISVKEQKPPREVLLLIKTGANDIDYRYHLAKYEDSYCPTRGCRPAKFITQTEGVYLADDVLWSFVEPPEDE